MTSEYRNYIVTFMPDGEQTVDQMRVVDAWATTGDLDYADARMRRHREAGRYASHGAGRLTIAEQGGSTIQYAD